MTTLPGIAGDIEAVIGLELTVKLLRLRGGTEISIPVNAPGTKLAEMIGVEATRKLAKDYGTGKVVLPCAGMRGRDAIQRQRKEEAMTLLRQGASIQRVALACDLGLRTVSNYRAELTRHEQPELPL